MEVCPCNIIALNDNKEIYFLPDRESICLKCGQCMAVCNTDSIKISGISYQDELFDLPENPIHYKEFMDFLATRRSVRNFKDTPVPDELIQKIIAAITFAPYGSAPNEVYIKVVNGRKRIEKGLPLMSQFLDNVVKWMENPFMRFIIKRKKGIETFNTLKNHLYPIAKSGNYKLEPGDRITREAPALLLFHADKAVEEHTDNSMIYALYAMFAAHSLGLGATMVSLVPAAINKVPKLQDIFEIPKNHEVVISVIIGYPKIKYKKAIVRPKKNISWMN